MKNQISITWTPVSEWTESRTQDEMLAHGTMFTNLLLWAKTNGFPVCKEGVYNFYTDRFEITENGKQWQRAEITHFAYVNSPEQV